MSFNADRVVRRFTCRRIQDSEALSTAVTVWLLFTNEMIGRTILQISSKIRSHHPRPSSKPLGALLMPLNDGSDEKA